MSGAKFLDLFDEQRRPWAAGRFVAARRDGAEDAEQIVSDILAEADERAAQDPSWSIMRWAIEHAPDEAVAFAAELLEIAK